VGAETITFVNPKAAILKKEIVSPSEGTDLTMK